MWPIVPMYISSQTQNILTIQALALHFSFCNCLLYNKSRKMLSAQIPTMGVVITFKKDGQLKHKTQHDNNWLLIKYKYYILIASIQYTRKCLPLYIEPILQHVFPVFCSAHNSEAFDYIKTTRLLESWNLCTMVVDTQNHFLCTLQVN